MYVKRLVLSPAHYKNERNVGSIIISTWRLRKWGSERLNKVNSVTRLVNSVKPKSVQALVLPLHSVFLPFSPTCQILYQITPIYDPKYLRTLCLVILDAMASLPNNDSPATVICFCNETGGPVGNSWLNQAIYFVLFISMASAIVLYTFYYNLPAPRL